MSTSGKFQKQPVICGKLKNFQKKEARKIRENNIL